MSKLTDQLLERRRSLGLSQAAAGHCCDPPITRQAISEIETGTSDPHLSTLQRYARQALGVDLILTSGTDRHKSKERKRR